LIGGGDSGRVSEPAWYEGSRLTVRWCLAWDRLSHKGSNMMDVVQAILALTVLLGFAALGVYRVRMPKRNRKT
jgi:hypothetical protein